MPIRTYFDVERNERTYNCVSCNLMSVMVIEKKQKSRTILKGGWMLKYEVTGIVCCYFTILYTVFLTDRRCVCAEDPSPGT